MKKKKKNMVGSILMISSIFAILMSTAIGIIGYNHIKTAYYTSFAEGLHAAAILLNDELSNEFAIIQTLQSPFS